MTDRGGFLMGNPNAPVKLLEYASITCPHCAEFSEQGGATAARPLRPLGPGQLGISALHDLPDRSRHLHAAALPRPAGLLPRLRAALRRSAQLGRRGCRRIPPEQARQLDSMPPPQQAAALIRATGLDQFFRQRGLPEARMNACLADPNNLQQLGEITRRASEEDNVTGTPTFFINGEKTDRPADWARLEPLLRAAVGG